MCTAMYHMILDKTFKKIARTIACAYSVKNGDLSECHTSVELVYA
jgi:hypothetical protein